MANEKMLQDWAQAVIGNDGGLLKLKIRLTLEICGC